MDDKDKPTQTDDTTQTTDQQDTTPKEETLNDDPVLGSFIDDLLGKEPSQEDVAPAPEGDDEDNDDSSASADSDANDTNGEPEPKAEEKVKVVKRKSIQEQVREELDKAQPSQPAADQPKPDQPKVDDPAPTQEDIVLDGLSEEEQDYLDLLNYASKKAGHKYSDELKKFSAFVNKRNQIRDRILKEEPDADLDDSDTIQKFTAKNRPTLPRKEIKDIERMQIRESIESDLKETYDKKFEELDARGKKAEVEPVVKSQADAFSAELVNLAKDAEKSFQGDTTIPELVEAMDKEGVEAVRERNPLFADMVVGAIQSGTTAAKEFIRLMKFAEKGLNVYDENNQTHKFLTEFIINQDGKFASLANDPRKVRVGNDGVRRTFVPQAEFAVMPPEAQNKHWTFSTQERLRMIQANTIMQMRHNVDDLRKKLEASGWTRKQIDKELGSQPQKKGNKEPSPKVKQSISPGPAQGKQEQQSQSVMSADELAAFGLKDQ